MSTQAVHEFIAKVNGDPNLAAEVLRAMTVAEGAEVTAIAGRLGFAFSREDGQKVWDELLASGELPDQLLDAVSGGDFCSTKCANTGLDGGALVKFF